MITGCHDVSTWVTFALAFLILPVLHWVMAAMLWRAGAPRAVNRLIIALATSSTFVFVLWFISLLTCWEAHSP